MDDPLRIKMACVVLDCADANALADFYTAFLGWEKWDDAEWIGVSAENVTPFLLMQPVGDYKPPAWPDEPEAQRQMVHIDFAVNDLQQAVDHAVKCGAKVSPVQYDEGWTVLFDPAGHPFCLLQRDWV